MFTVLFFDEQQSNINSVFASFDGGGCKTIYEGREVHGSDLYGWFDKHKSTLGMPIISRLGLWACELSSEENFVTFSYFVYLDGTAPDGLSYAGRNDPDFYGDTDSAFEDTVKDFGTDVKDFFHELWYGDSVGAIIFKVILGIIALVALVLIVFFFIKLIKILIRWIKGD